MLINAKGAVVHIPHIPQKSPNYANILAPLREVLEPTSKHLHGVFSIQARARYKA